MASQGTGTCLVWARPHTRMGFKNFWGEFFMDNGLGPASPRSVDRPARCIFCGGIGVWWSCGCEWGEKIRAGKVLKPRTVVRGGVPVIELCEELRGAARAAGVIRGEYRRDGKDGSARNHGVEPRDDSLKVAETAELSESSEISESDLRTCPSCGKGFRARSARQKYCSDVCRARAQRG